jgi:hypothetical protein
MSVVNFGCFISTCAMHRLPGPAVFVLSPVSRFSVGIIVLESSRLVIQLASWSPSLIDVSKEAGWGLRRETDSPHIRFIGEVSQTPDHLHNIVGACSPRGHRVVRFPYSSTTPALLVSPPRRSVQRAIDYLALEERSCLNRSLYKSHPNHRPSLLCLLAESISSPQAVCSPPTYPPKFTICPRLTVVVRASL